MLEIFIITIASGTIFGFLLNTKEKNTKKSFHKAYSEKWKDDFIQPRKINKCKTRISKATVKEYSEIEKNKFRKTDKYKNMKKGMEYEMHIAEHYRKLGYTSIEHGIINGKKDLGIDLIVKKDKEIILIQCKNWNEKGKWKINHEKILAFRARARDFVEAKPIFKNYKLTARYTLSGNFIDLSAIKHIEEVQRNGKKVDYEIIRMPKR